MKSTGRTGITLIAAAAALGACLVHAQSYPSKPIRIVVPYPPGGGVDVVVALVFPGERQGAGEVVDHLVHDFADLLDPITDRSALAAWMDAPQRADRLVAAQQGTQRGQQPVREGEGVDGDAEGLRVRGDDLEEQATGIVEEVIESTVRRLVPEDLFAEEWDRDLVLAGIREVFPTTITRGDLEALTSTEELVERAVEDALARYEDRERLVGEGPMRQLERLVLLNLTDTKWREHLYEMDYLQEGIHLRAIAQRDPITEYRREAYAMFEELTASIREDFVKYIYRVELVRQDEPGRPRPQRVSTNASEVAAPTGGGGAAGGATTELRSDKVPRNAPCPCGSGKKFKKCHGAAA